VVEVSPTGPRRINNPGAAAATCSRDLLEGLADPDLRGRRAGFLNGEPGIIINRDGGVWTTTTPRPRANVGSRTNRAERPDLYGARRVGATATCGSSADESPAEELDACLDFLKFLNDNNFQWSRTGHLSCASR
jgi:multiple sugar transport system substrate-binding protein